MEYIYDRYPLDTFKGKTKEELITLIETIQKEYMQKQIQGLKNYCESLDLLDYSVGFFTGFTQAINILEKNK